MARRIVVKGAAVVLRTVDKRESYFYRGAVLPTEGFTDETLAHAESLGLIEVVEVEDEIAEAEVVEVELPKATDSHAEIDAFADKFSIDLSGLGKEPTREDKIAEIERVVAERTAAAEASGTLQ